MKDFGDNEIFIPKGKFEGMTNIQKRDLDAVNINYKGGVPILATLHAFYSQYAQVRTTLKGSGVDVELEKIKALQEYEKLTYAQIKNQEKLGQLIEKPIAQSRMLGTLSGYKGMLILCIKEASLQMSGDNRKNETMLTNVFNAVMGRIIEEQGEIKSWEEDGSIRLLTTRIIDSKEQSGLDDEIKLREVEKDDLNDILEVDFDILNED